MMAFVSQEFECARASSVIDVPNCSCCCLLVSRPQNFSLTTSSRDADRMWGFLNAGTLGGGVHHFEPRVLQDLRTLLESLYLSFTIFYIDLP